MHALLSFLILHLHQHPSAIIIPDLVCIHLFANGTKSSDGERTSVVFRGSLLSSKASYDEFHVKKVPRALQSHLRFYSNLNVSSKRAGISINLMITREKNNVSPWKSVTNISNP